MNNILPTSTSPSVESQQQATASTGNNSSYSGTSGSSNTEVANSTSSANDAYTQWLYNYIQSLKKNTPDDRFSSKASSDSTNSSDNGSINADDSDTEIDDIPGYTLYGYEALDLGGQATFNINDAAKEEFKDFEERQRNLFIYLCGSDLETKYGMGSDDLVKIVNSNYNEENLNVIVICGGAKEWNSNPMKTDLTKNGNKCAMYYMSPNKGTEEIGLDELEKYLFKIAEMKDEYMGDPAVLARFINTASELFPAYEQSLILWNHGGGITGGVCNDEYLKKDKDNPNFYLSMVDIGNALETLGKDKNHFEFIGFDACLMGNIEVADMIQSYADYCIMSEEVEAGSWEYEDITSNGSTEPSFVKMMSQGAKTKEYCRQIIKSYEVYHKKTKFVTQTLSMIDLRELDDVGNELDGFARSLLKYSEINKADANERYLKARLETYDFGLGDTDREEFYDYIDLIDFADCILNAFPESDAEGMEESAAEAYNNVRNHAKKLRDATEKSIVEYTISQGKESHYGLSIYHPFYKKYSNKYDIYKNNAAWNAYIKYFINSYVSKEYDSNPFDMIESRKFVYDGKNSYIELDIVDERFDEFVERINKMYIRFFEKGEYGDNEYRIVSEDIPVQFDGLDKPNKKFRIYTSEIDYDDYGLYEINDGKNTIIQRCNYEDKDESTSGVFEEYLFGKLYDSNGDSLDIWANVYFNLKAESDEKYVSRVEILDSGLNKTKEIYYAGDLKTKVETEGWQIKFENTNPNNDFSLGDCLFSLNDLECIRVNPKKYYNMFFAQLAMRPLDSEIKYYDKELVDLRSDKRIYGPDDMIQYAKVVASDEGIVYRYKVAAKHWESFTNSLKNSSENETSPLSITAASRGYGDKNKYNYIYFDNRNAIKFDDGRKQLDIEIKKSVIDQTFIITDSQKKNVFPNVLDPSNNDGTTTYYIVVYTEEKDGGDRKQNVLAFDRSLKNIKLLDGEDGSELDNWMEYYYIVGIQSSYTNAAGKYEIEEVDASEGIEIKALNLNDLDFTSKVTINGIEGNYNNNLFTGYESSSVTIKSSKAKTEKSSSPTTAETESLSEFEPSTTEEADVTAVDESSATEDLNEVENSIENESQNSETIEQQTSEEEINQTIEEETDEADTTIETGETEEVSESAEVIDLSEQITNYTGPVNESVEDDLAA